MNLLFELKSFNYYKVFLLIALACLLGCLNTFRLFGSQWKIIFNEAGLRSVVLHERIKAKTSAIEKNVRVLNFTQMKTIAESLAKTNIADADKPNVLIFDVRPAWAYQQGHIPNSDNLPYHTAIENTLEDLKSYSIAIEGGANILLYCQSITCDMAWEMARQLTVFGYSNLSVYEGGYKEWEQKINE